MPWPPPSLKRTLLVVRVPGAPLRLTAGPNDLPAFAAEPKEEPALAAEPKALQVGDPELMFNGGVGVMKDLKTLQDEMHATNDFDWLSLTTSDSGSYRSLNHVIEYLEKLLEPMHEGRDIRILMCDAYAAHLDPAVRRLAWTRGYIVIYPGGGTTGVGQVNDTDLHEKVSDRYQELEQEYHLLQI
jgi:hypothetical protein